MAPSFGRVTPVLRSFDEAKAREFYLDWLGFALDWEHRFAADLPLYQQSAGRVWSCTCPNTTATRRRAARSASR